MQPIVASGNNIRNILATVRRAKGWTLSEAKETFRSGGEDNLWRIHLANGEIIEATVVQHQRCMIHV